MSVRSVREISSALISLEIKSLFILLLLLFELRQANLVLIAYASSEGSGEPAHPWPLWIAGHAQLKFVMTECSKIQIRLTGLIWCLCLQVSASIMELSIQRGSSGRMPVTTYVNVSMIILDSISVLRGKVLCLFYFQFIYCVEVR